jgi:hypothetical protein
VAFVAHLPEGARRIDPAAEAERLGRERIASAGCVAPLLDEYHRVTVSGMPQFVRITLTAEQEFPVRGDLGERIAALVREDLEQAAPDD